MARPPSLISLRPLSSLLLPRTSQSSPFLFSFFPTASFSHPTVSNSSSSFLRNPLTSSGMWVLFSLFLSFLSFSLYQSFLCLSLSLRAAVFWRSLSYWRQQGYQRVWESTQPGIFIGKIFLFLWVFFDMGRSEMGHTYGWSNCLKGWFRGAPFEF